MILAVFKKKKKIQLTIIYTVERLFEVSGDII